MSKLHRYYLENHAYHVASVTHNRIPLLRDYRNAESIVGALQWLRKERSYLLAYVVMPDHFHAVLVPLGEQTISRLMQSVKGFTARMLNGDKRGPVWQQGFYDRIIRNERHLTETIRYIHDNPVVAGFVTEAAEYPLSSAFPGMSTDLDLFL